MLYKILFVCIKKKQRKLNNSKTLYIDVKQCKKQKKLEKENKKKTCVKTNINQTKEQENV